MRTQDAEETTGAHIISKDGKNVEAMTWRRLYARV
jgi:hypothetical protein